MRAAVLAGLGETPKYGEFREPVAGAGQVVVEVLAAALKPADRLAAAGVHYAPAELPAVVGLDGVGRLADGSRVGFSLPVSPFGGMAERTLVRTGNWLPVPDGVDDVAAAAFMNPGMAAWKTIVWEGGVEAGQTVLVLGATGMSGRIAAQLAIGRGARVVVAGRDQAMLDRLVEMGAAGSVRVDGDGVGEAVAGWGPFDLVADYLWGTAAEAAFAGLGGTRPVRYLVVGMAAGETANIPAIALRRVPVQIVGSGHVRAASMADAAAAFGELSGEVAAGRLVVDAEAVPLAEVGRVWESAGRERRVVLVP